MGLELYQVNAFTCHFNGGNPAGVVPLDKWLSDETLQAIAQENGFSETAFYITKAQGFALRWFTPGCEVDLCGHATLATAYVLDRVKGLQGPFQFETRSGIIEVEVTPTGSPQGSLFTLDMPANELTQVECPVSLMKGIGGEPLEVWQADDYLAVLESEDLIRQLEPDFSQFQHLSTRGVIVTAPSSDPDFDFVSRWFGGPSVGIDEDPVTGSAHCSLIPYWSKRLAKNDLQAKQISAREGVLVCQNLQSRVKVGGHGVLYFDGHIHLPGV